MKNALGSCFLLKTCHISSTFFNLIGKPQKNNQKLSPSKQSQVKKSPVKSSYKPSSVKPAKISPTKSIKTNKTSSSESSSANASSAKIDASEGKTFTSFSENVEQVNENDQAKSVGDDSTRSKMEGIENIVE